MRAALFDTFAGPIRIEDVPTPEVPRDGVVIRVEATGVCRSDWHGWMGHDPDIRLPHVPGHELAGVVEETGPDVRGWRAGERVTVPFAVGCGRCEQCAAGHQHICDDYFQPGFTAWGSFASYVAIPHADRNLIRLPDELGFVEAASLGCRFSTAFRAVVIQGALTGGELVVVHGCGGVGLSAIMIARAMGAEVVGVDIDEDALRLARVAGADHVVDGSAVSDVADAVRSLAGGRGARGVGGAGGAHLSIDALGSRTTCVNSIRCLGKRGRHVQVGLMVADDEDAPIPMQHVIGKELVILGSHGLAAHAYHPLLEMIRTGRLEPGKLVTKTVALDEGIRELATMGEFRTRGVVVIDRLT